MISTTERVSLSGNKIVNGDVSGIIRNSTIGDADNRPLTLADLNVIASLNIRSSVRFRINLDRTIATLESDLAAEVTRNNNSLPALNLNGVSKLYQLPENQFPACSSVQQVIYHHRFLEGRLPSQDTLAENVNVSVVQAHNVHSKQPQLHSSLPLPSTFTSSGLTASVGSNNCFPVCGWGQKPAVLHNSSGEINIPMVPSKTICAGATPVHFTLRILWPVWTKWHMMNVPPACDILNRAPVSWCYICQVCQQLGCNAPEKSAVEENVRPEDIAINLLKHMITSSHITNAQRLDEICVQQQLLIYPVNKLLLESSVVETTILLGKKPLYPISRKRKRFRYGDFCVMLTDQEVHFRLVLNNPRQGRVLITFEAGTSVGVRSWRFYDNDKLDNLIACEPEGSVMNSHQSYVLIDTETEHVFYVEASFRQELPPLSILALFFAVCTEDPTNKQEIHGEPLSLLIEFQQKAAKQRSDY